MKNLLCLLIAGVLLLGCKSTNKQWSSDQDNYMTKADKDKEKAKKEREKARKEEAKKPKDPLGVQDSNPGEYMFVAGAGKKIWYSSLELEQLVRDYITKKDIEFDFPHSTKAIWVNTDGGKKLASMYFQLQNGEFLQVDISREGEVTGHKKGPDKKGDK